MSADSQGPPDSPDSQGPRLDSWKEIAAYLNRHVTTVRRWEKHEGLPVHRHVHDKLGSVYTFREELDDWWRSRRLHLKQQHNGETVPIADRLDEPPPDATTTPSQEIGDEWRAAVRVNPESYVRSGAIRNLQRRFWIVGSVHSSRAGLFSRDQTVAMPSDNSAGYAAAVSSCPAVQAPIGQGGR